MRKLLTNSSYQSILSDIEAVCLTARKALGQMYWQVGRRIVEAEQEGNPKAPYGKQLIKWLSKNLTAKFGSGFSEGHLEKMRRFYLENRISLPAEKLLLSHQIEALSIKDPKRRKMLLEKAIRKNLTRSQFRQLLHNEKISTEPGLTKIDAVGSGLKPFPTYGLPKITGGLKPLTTQHGLSEIVRGLKTFSSCKINEKINNGINFQWQKSFYDNIIRNETSLNEIRTYIIENPAKWEFDKENKNNKVGNGHDHSLQYGGLQNERQDSSKLQRVDDNLRLRRGNTHALYKAEYQS